MDYPRIILKKGRDAALRHGHPWLFSGALATVEGKPEPGEIVLAADAGGRPLGLGFFNTGDIAFRLLTDDPAARIDTDFWRRRIERALALRRKVIPPETDACRLINAEGDGMPGLVVDRYGSYLVMTIGTAGMEKWRGHRHRTASGDPGAGGDSRAERGALPAVGRTIRPDRSRGRGCPGVGGDQGKRPSLRGRSARRAEDGILPRSASQPGDRRCLQLRGGGPELLLLYRGVFGLCRPRRGASCRLRGGLGGGQRDRPPEPCPQRLFSGSAPPLHRQCLRLFPGYARGVRPDHPRSSRLRQIAEGCGPLGAGLQGDQSPGGEMSPGGRVSRHLFLLQSRSSPSSSRRSSSAPSGMRERPRSSSASSGRGPTIP